MQTMPNHQVMAIAPPDIRETNFGEVFDPINAEAPNKRLYLQIEIEELTIHMKKLEKKKKEMEMDSMMPDFAKSGNEYEAEEEEKKEMTDGVIDFSKYCYPSEFALVPSGGPHLDYCQGTGGKKRRFHHA